MNNDKLTILAVIFMFLYVATTVADKAAARKQELALKTIELERLKLLKGCPYE